MRRQGWRVVVGVVGLMCLVSGVCGNSAFGEMAGGVPGVLGSSVVGEGSPASDAAVTGWWPYTDKLLSVAATSSRVTVPDLTLVALDGSRLIVVETVDARCHPKEREPQVAAVGATSGQEE